MYIKLRCWSLCSALAVLFGCYDAAVAQLRIVTYNTATAQAEGGTQTAREPFSSTILEAIGLESVGGIAKPIDVLLLQEQYSLESTTQSFVDLLNDLYDPVHRTMYARGTVRGAASSDFAPPNIRGSGGRPGVIYNTQSVELIGEVAFGSVGSGEALARQYLRYQFRPVGYDSSADFYAYSSHYRAGDDGINAVSRLNEAAHLRSNSDALGEGTHAIYAGDYNITSSFTSMYQHLLSDGPGQAFDPIDTPGNWHDNGSVKLVHTQSPAATGEAIPGFAGGGMDDRFDFQLVTGEMLDDEGLSMIAGSYRAFGNNGTHNLNGSITTGNGAPIDILTALKANSDHLPVVADYQLPAKMLASLAAVPTQVTRGAIVGIDVLVENIADVLTPNGADELDYTIDVSGALLGSAGGISFPLAGANAHQIFLDTGTSGFRTGVVTVNATSQGAANRLYQFPVSFTVGGGNGGPVFGVIARDTFDENQNLVSFTQSPEPAAYGSIDDGFQVYSSTGGAIPSQLVDTSTSGSPSDTRGIINPITKTDTWFGITDTINESGEPAEHPGVGIATWVFDVAGAIDLHISIDMAAMGDFEATGATADYFDWTYQFDNGPVLPLFTSTVNEAIEQDYTMADGDIVSLDDPIEMVSADNQLVLLTNMLQKVTSPLSGLGDLLTIQLMARTDGGDEAYAFDNIVIEGSRFVEFLAADFNQDGKVDELDLAQWQGDYGIDAESDADFDGDTDGADFLIWQRQFGQTSSMLEAAASVTVPEPSALVLLLVGPVMGGIRWGNRL